MKFAELLEIVGDEPVFEAGLLLAGDRDPAHVRRQLSRWVEAAKIYQLRRGLYALAPPFQKVLPHPFLVANRLMRGSYVSLQSALAHYGMIPEYVPVTTSVGPGRNHRRQTPLGSFDFHHLQAPMRKGAQWIELAGRQWASVASPEKALLDRLAQASGKAKLARAAASRAMAGRKGRRFVAEPTRGHPHMPLFHHRTAV